MPKQTSPGCFQDIISRKDFPLYTPSTEDDRLLLMIQNALREGPSGENTKELDDCFQNSSFYSTHNRRAILIYQGDKRISIVRKTQPALQQLSTLLQQFRNHKHFDDIDLNIPFRIQLDFIHKKPERTTFDKIFDHELDSPDRFEYGVDGLRIGHNNNIYYFFPGDAYVRSVMGSSQLARAIRRLTGQRDLHTLTYSIFRSESYISHQGHWLRLYRGYPVITDVSVEEIRRVADLALEHVATNQNENGQFLYYYDGATDTRRDHEHPTRNPDIDPYYNILRHSGGALLYLFQEEICPTARFLPYAKRAIGFLLKQCIDYTSEHYGEATYVYYNRKGKLGGSGLALYLLSEYQRISGDRSYENQARRLKNHLLEQITESGEFIYYNIYLDKQVTPEQNAELFSFYYPGEALNGLAAYCKSIGTEAENQRQIYPLIKRALRFLFIDRVQQYQDQYTSLPSDSWLMIAVSELWDIPDFRDTLYSAAVFKDADAMCRLMYTPHDGLYPDYPGAFYYKYGDFPYADGARCEGLLGAYELALKTGDEERIERYRSGLRLATLAVMHLVNTEASCYFSQHPETIIGGIRFKYTRQWFRIDTTQHVAGFFLKMLPYAEGIFGIHDG